MKNFLVHNDEIKKEMLQTVGVKSVSELFKQVPEAAKFINPDFGTPLSEMEVQRKIKQLAKENKSDFILLDISPKFFHLFNIIKKPRITN